MTESKEPTQEQQKKGWEWCGLHHNKPSGGFWWDADDNLVLDMHKGETGIDLNNLFKYFVPKLFEKIGKLQTVALVTNAVCDAVETHGEIKDYLFWAIYKAAGLEE